MAHNCNNCKCNTCGNMYWCEILMERVIHNDKINSSQCEPILNCSLYTEEKDYTLYTTWKCEMKKKILGGE